jgi:hypothetical protein
VVVKLQLLGRLRPEDHKFKASLGNIVRPPHPPFKTKQKARIYWNFVLL